jgi:hypothetical protein
MWLAASTYDMVVPLRANRHKTVGTVGATTRLCGAAASKSLKKLPLV